MPCVSCATQAQELVDTTQALHSPSSSPSKDLHKTRMQNIWRNHKYKIIIGGFLTYAASTAVIYQMRREKRSLAVDMLREGDNPPNEKRKLVFDFISMDYDTKVSRDEWILGINKKRYKKHTPIKAYSNTHIQKEITREL